MSIDQVINQFFGVRCKSMEGLSLSKVSDCAISGPVPNGLVADPSPGAMPVLMMSDQFAARLASKISTFGNTATLGGIAFKAYDNWKHQDNEVTDIAAEVDFRQYGLAQSGVEALEFELMMMKAMMKSAKDGHVDAGIQGAGSASFESLPHDENNDSVVNYFVNNDLLIDEIVSKDLSLELKIELYLAVYLVAGLCDLSQASFFKSLTKGLQLPDEIISQVRFQVPQSLRRAA